MTCARLSFVKNQRTGHISEALAPTDFILGTKIQPIKAHSMAQVPMTLTKDEGQGQIWPKMVKKLSNGAYLRCYFTYSLHTWYQGTTHKCASNDPSAYDLDQRPRSKVKVKISPKWVK